MSTGHDVTLALHRFRDGDERALDRVLPLVYDQLRAIARRALNAERSGHTLTPTALVHETYLKLVQLERVTFQDRSHFFAACAREMRRTLIDHARRRDAGKRGGGAEHVPLENAVAAAQERPAELLALDEALDRLEKLSPRQARVVECRFYAGMDVSETAAALGLSSATIKRDWTAARAWLNRELAT